MEEKSLEGWRAWVSYAFPGLEAAQWRQLEGLEEVYGYWNARINVVSRKDIGHLYGRHVLPSLVLGKVVSLQAGADVLDMGTGGGFPGIPLAILFPRTHFYLVDSVHKKTQVVRHVGEALGLKNVTVVCQRAETLEGRYDFILARGVARLAKLYAWGRGKVKAKGVHEIPNGWLCWKGGDLREELEEVPLSHTAYPLKRWLPSPDMDDKVMVHLFLREYFGGLAHNGLSLRFIYVYAYLQNHKNVCRAVVHGSLGPSYAQC